MAQGRHHINLVTPHDVGSGQFAASNSSLPGNRGLFVWPLGGEGDLIVISQPLKQATTTEVAEQDEFAVQRGSGQPSKICRRRLSSAHDTILSHDPDNGSPS